VLGWAPATGGWAVINLGELLEGGCYKRGKSGVRDLSGGKADIIIIDEELAIQ
jgi:hypothetical protein